MSLQSYLYLQMRYNIDIILFLSDDFEPSKYRNVDQLAKPNQSQIAVTDLNNRMHVV
jgi:hypothetical protein